MFINSDMEINARVIDNPFQKYRGNGIYWNCISLLGVIQNCHHFHESTQSTLGGGGQGLPTLFKMLIMMHCIFIRGSSKSAFSKYFFLGREGFTKKSTLYGFDNVHNYGRPLTVRILSTCCQVCACVSVRVCCLCLQQFPFFPPQPAGMQLWNPVTTYFDPGTVSRRH